MVLAGLLCSLARNGIGCGSCMEAWQHECMDGSNGSGNGPVEGLDAF